MGLLLGVRHTASQSLLQTVALSDMNLTRGLMVTYGGSRSAWIRCLQCQILPPWWEKAGSLDVGSRGGNKTDTQSFLFSRGYWVAPVTAPQHPSSACFLPIEAEPLAWHLLALGPRCCSTLLQIKALFSRVSVHWMQDCLSWAAVLLCVVPLEVSQGIGGHLLPLLPHPFSFFSKSTFTSENLRAFNQGNGTKPRLLLNEGSYLP